MRGDRPMSILELMYINTSNFFLLLLILSPSDWSRQTVPRRSVIRVS